MQIFIANYWTENRELYGRVKGRIEGKKGKKEGGRAPFPRVLLCFSIKLPLITVDCGMADRFSRLS